MIPENYNLPVSQKPEYTPLPADTYEVRIKEINLLAEEPVYNKPGETENKFKFTFEVTEPSFSGRKVFKKCPPKMTAGSNGYAASTLYQIFSAVNSVSLKDDEAASVTAKNINEMEGKSLRLVLQVAEGKDGQYNKITGYLPTKLIDIGAAQKQKEIAELADMDVSDIPF